MSENSHGPEIFASEKVSFVNYVQVFSSLFINYLRQTADKLIILAVIYSAFSLLAYFLYLLIKAYVKDEQNELMRRVLIVTAHPDDECMFFGPTIVNLRARNIPVHLLCLSPGDSFPNKRAVRKAELWQSCIALGLDERYVVLKKLTLLMDGHNNEWCHKLISKIILTHIEMLDIDTVITFDEMGVSEHPNHIAVFNAMAHLVLNHLLPKDVCFYSLDSVNRLRKYSFMLDFLTSFFISKLCIISNLKQQYQIVKAMSCHQSQFVWFRKLYIILSRYVSINTLKTWTRDDLKESVNYQELVDGMKYKNKWYESLDDSLKKINSEQIISPVTKTDDFEAEENTDGDDDAEVSFVAKASPLPVSESPSPPPLVRSSPSPDPSKLAANESIHNGEVYVRKSRFLIPKTYASFYNSSSSETSDDKDEETSSSNTSLDKLIAGQTGEYATEEIRSVEKSSIETSLDDIDGQNTISDATLLCTEDDQSNLSYEIEDIESVLDEVDGLDAEVNEAIEQIIDCEGDYASVDVSGNYLQIGVVKRNEHLKEDKHNDDESNNDIETRSVQDKHNGDESNNDIETRSVQDKHNDDESNNDIETRSVQDKHNGDGSNNDIKTTEATDIHTEGKVNGEQADTRAENIAEKDVKILLGQEKTLESSNSSEQESAVDDLHVNNLNKRNKKKRRNKKKKESVDEDGKTHHEVPVKEEKTRSHMSENNQNVFNMERGCEEDTNAILQTVSTN